MFLESAITRSFRGQYLCTATCMSSFRKIDRSARRDRNRPFTGLTACVRVAVESDSPYSAACSKSCLVSQLGEPWLPRFLPRVEAAEEEEAGIADLVEIQAVYTSP
jgi:hypothetical protein